MPRTCGVTIRDKTGETAKWQDEVVVGGSGYSPTVSEFLSTGGMTGITPISSGITAISLTAGGTPLADDYVLTFEGDADYTFYDATPHTGPYKLLKVIHNGCYYEVGGGGNKTYSMKYLVVGGGGNGGPSYGAAGGGGGGGGQVVSAECCNMLNCIYEVHIGKNVSSCTCVEEGTSSIVSLGMSLSAKGGMPGCQAGAGGMSGSGCLGGNKGSYGGGGGGGFATVGCNGSGKDGGTGGSGSFGYGGGGGGGGQNCYSGTVGYGGCGCSGGGNGANGAYGGGGPAGGGAATNCGGGGGGAGGSYCSCWSAAGGTGGCGVVHICYKTTGTGKITCATGGNCCYTCNGYCVHEFTSDGVFSVFC